jgi:hypothetical protein
MADARHVETDVKVFMHDLYIDAVMLAVKLGLGFSLFKASILGHAVMEVGHEVVIEASPAYVTSAVQYPGTAV